MVPKRKTRLGLGPLRPARSANCPLCRDPIEPSDLSLGGSCPCPVCETAYHRACYEELGGCSTLGCAGVRPADLGTPPRISPALAAEDSESEPAPGSLRAWGLTLVFMIAARMSPLETGETLALLFLAVVGVFACTAWTNRRA